MSGHPVPSNIEHQTMRIMPDPERGLRQMATRVIEHSITHILPDQGGAKWPAREHSAWLSALALSACQRSSHGG
jgi:hypothetical protein